MIFDKIENIENYNEISKDVQEFVKKLYEGVEVGRYVLNENCYANVEEYYTKTPEICKLEAHKDYADIQFLLSGKEELQYTNIEGLEVSEEYIKERDIMFFKSPDSRLNSLILSNGYFAYILPYEAHQPQMNYGETSAKVKKVVVKVRV